MSQISKVMIPVRMGSKKLNINYEFCYNNFQLSPSQLIEIVLRKLFSKSSDLSLLIKTYSLYENAFGVERLVDKCENLLGLLINQNRLDSNVFFVIRKKNTKPATIRPKYNLNSKKCFKKLQMQKEHQENSLKVIEDSVKQSQKSVCLYEDIDSYCATKTQLKEAFLRQIFQNEIILNEQLNKLENFDKILIRQEQESSSKSFFKSIYAKLKNHHKKQQQQASNLNQSSIYLLDSAGECSSNSSSRSTSSSKLDTLF